MDVLIVSLIENLKIIGIIFGIFALCVIANILIKTYYNVFDLEHKFSWKRFLYGIIKMIIVGVTTGILCIVTTVIHYIPILENLIDTPEGKVLANNITIVGLYFVGIVRYFTDTLKGLGDVMKSKINEGEGSP